MSIELNSDNYDGEVLKSKVPVLVDFWGPQCKPCLALMPLIDELEKECTGKLKVAKVNAGENRMLCAKLRVLGLPTYILYKGGTDIKRLTGYNITEKDLRDAIATVIV